MRVRLVKRRKPPLEYDAEVVSDDGNHLVVRAPFTESTPVDLGFVRFEPGDTWVESYWRDRWYSVKAIVDPGGRLKGWYCDIARPAVVDGDGDELVSEDLELDLWVSADRSLIRRLDEDETDFTPEISAAIEELERLAHTGQAPFRDRRLVFGADAEGYDRIRPSYPAALVDDIVDLVGPTAHALDIGCGTGKATELLAGRGMTGVGVDADPEMAAVARRRLAPFDGWRIDVSPFEGWTPTAGDGPFDVVMSATAWHWLDPDVRLRKSYELLRPGGWLALAWNRDADDESPLAQAIDRIHDDLAPELRPVNHVTRARDTPPGERRAYYWTQPYSAGEYTALAATYSRYLLLPPDRLEPLLAAVHAVIDAHGGVYDYRYESVLWVCRREDLLPGD